MLLIDFEQQLLFFFIVYWLIVVEFAGENYLGTFEWRMCLYNFFVLVDDYFVGVLFGGFLHNF